MRNARTEKSCGAVVYTEIGGKRRYLLVDSIRETNCGFPKGHMEDGETKEETALREIEEETCKSRDSAGMQIICHNRDAA